MAIEIIVPPLGESVQEATVLSILKKQGSSVEADEMLVELETEKVTLEINAPSSGIISSFSVKEGDTVRVGQIIGKIDESAVSSKSSASEKQVAQSNLDVETKVKEISEKVLSPAVRRVIEESNLNPSSINGTGRDGMITKADALEAASKPTSVVSESALPKAQVSAKGLARDEKIVKMTKLRQTIARRLKDSQNNAAILTTFNEVDMSAVMALRNEYKDIFEKKNGVKLGFMSFFARAVIYALSEIPAVNAEIRGDEIIYKNFYDLGIAVGTENGLVVPVIRDAQNLSIAGIEKAIYEYGVKARDGKLTMADLSGGTFTISNGGVYGSLLSTPIINPPQSGILGMHKIQDRAVVINGKIEIRPMMYMALSYDHRIVDGKEAVTFLVKVKEVIEDPRRLVLDI